MDPLEELERHVEKESPANKVVATVVAILSAALLIWAGYRVYMTASAEKRGGVTRSPQTAVELQRNRDLLEREKRNNEEREAAERMDRERDAAEQRDQVRFGR